MSQPAEIEPGSWTNRIRAGLGRRAGGFLFAVLIELLILLALLSLSLSPNIVSRKGEQLTVFSVGPEKEEAETPDEAPAPSDAKASAAQPPTPREAAPQPAKPEIPPLPWATVPREQIEAADIAKIPEKPAKPAAPVGPVMGPPDRGRPGDSVRVGGSGPNGEPLYGAAWYREPYPDELSGYLSTARGPGWALIACKTVPDFRVEDCVMLDEYPSGSGIGRAVLAAAWQFRVRPPRVGGVSKVGEWVRIRIDYNLRGR